MPISFSAELVEYSKKRAERFAALQGKEAVEATTQVQASLVENVKSMAQAPGLTWHCDGPKTRAGTNTAPGPLQFFLSSMAFCQLTHYAENAALTGISLDEVRMVVKGSYNPLPGHGFDTIEFETHVTSLESQNRIQELAYRAEHECYVTNTMKKAARVTGRVFLNGRLLTQ